MSEQVKKSPVSIGFLAHVKQAEEHHIICPLKWYKTSLVAKYMG